MSVAIWKLSTQMECWKLNKAGFWNDDFITMSTISYKNWQRCWYHTSLIWVAILSAWIQAVVQSRVCALKKNLISWKCSQTQTGFQRICVSAESFSQHLTYYSNSHLPWRCGWDWAPKRWDGCRHKSRLNSEIQAGLNRYLNAWFRFKCSVKF